MSRVEGNYAGSYYNSTVQQNQQENVKKTRETENAKKTDKAKQPQLSKAAQNLLEKLRKNYSNIDFMIADFDSAEEAKDILSRGTKEVSVLFSSEELEKMAADEKYEKEYMDRVQGALRMSDEINKKYGYESAFGKDSGKSEITKISISFNKDGTMTYFAELEKSSNQQRERIEKTREKRAEEKKAAAKKEKANRDNVHTKKTTVQASSEEELIEKINEIDWSKIREERTQEGYKFDYSV